MNSEDDLDDAEPSRPPRKRSRKRKRRKSARSARGDESRRSHTVARRWTSGQLGLTLVIALGVGAFGGYKARGGGQAKDVAAPVSETPALGSVAATAAPAGDKFGRLPGDQHFGHDHPTQGAASPPGQAASASGPDALGRAPGSEHYGHNHQ